MSIEAEFPAAGQPAEGQPHDPAGYHPAAVEAAAQAFWDRTRAFEASADDYFVKPFSPIALLDKVYSLLG